MAVQDSVLIHGTPPKEEQPLIIEKNGFPTSATGNWKIVPEAARERLLQSAQ